MVFDRHAIHTYDAATSRKAMPSPSCWRSAILRNTARLLAACALALVVVSIGSTRARAAGPIITTIAGAGTGGDGPAADVRLDGPSGVAVGPDGALYVTDWSLCIVGKIADGTFTTVAGKHDCRYSGDGGPATSAGLNPAAVAVDARGDLYITDFINCRLRKVTDGTITTIAGNGTCSEHGDGGPALQGNFAHPFGVAVGPDGTAYVADQDNCRVRQVREGVISAAAGTLSCGYDGDGGPADRAQLKHPFGVVVAPNGDLYVADELNCRVRVVHEGIITTVAGNGTCGFAGDGGPATDAMLHWPYALALDATGNLFIADRQNCRIREVSSGVITTVAGDGNCAFSGDGGPATKASLNLPDGVAIDGDGNLYISDHVNHRVRKVALSTNANSSGVARSSDGGNGTMWRWIGIGVGVVAIGAGVAGVVYSRRRGANAP
ncbi:MAG: hypothetical protein EPO22_07415 [Dehalococcoidia bacterium]|nr:MAG: hypothetical protein EPO22_07415 [Dehalococcoidia bacterium]